MRGVGGQWGVEVTGGQTQTGNSSEWMRVGVTGRQTQMENGREWVRVGVEVQVTGRQTGNGGE